MTRTTIPLDQITVASPCHASWDAMTGDDRARFCDRCEKKVYNLSGMTHAEARALVTQNEGKLCVRFYRRADGTMLTQDCPVGLAALRRPLYWLGGVAAAFVVAALGLAATGVFTLVWVQHDRGGRLPEPIQTVMDWIFPPPVCVMGAPPPMPGLVVPPAPDAADPLEQPINE
jgi:hypothetical protein